MKQEWVELTAFTTKIIFSPDTQAIYMCQEIFILFFIYNVLLINKIFSPGWFKIAYSQKVSNCAVKLENPSILCCLCWVATKHKCVSFTTLMTNSCKPLLCCHTVDMCEQALPAGISYWITCTLFKRQAYVLHVWWLPI